MLNEFRRDLVSGEWVLFATGRSRTLVPKSRYESYQPKEDCPFEDGRIREQEIVWGYPNEKDWRMMLIKNKFPAVRPTVYEPLHQVGPFDIQTATGDHEIIVFRDHEKGFDDFSREEIVEAVKAYKRRHQELADNKEHNRYSMVFHNHGREAGASIYHAHSQIISTPILPPDVFHSITGSSLYYTNHNKRVYDVLLEWETKEKKRIVHENEHFLVFCPFVSKYPYEMRIFSKESHAHFERMPDAMDPFFADAIYTAVQKMKIVLQRPPFNFFIHSAPIDIAGKNEFGPGIHEFYQWHMEIIPHLKIDAGFEIGTGIEVNVVDPDEAAAALRAAKI